MHFLFEVVRKIFHLIRRCDFNSLILVHDAPPIVPLGTHYLTLKKDIPWYQCDQMGDLLDFMQLFKAFGNN